MLSNEQTQSYQENGFLHIPRVFTPDHTQALREDLNWMIDTWATKSEGWTGPWREALMDKATEAKSKLIAMHDLQFYAQSWMKGVTDDRLCDAISDLLAADGQRIAAGQDDGDERAVELHHSTLHVKPPETGHPFPMHQDWAFYEHEDPRFLAVLVHLDDTRHENGEIRFVAGSHRQGPLDHVRSFTDDNGETQPCTPHLPTDEYRLEDTVAVPAQAGDVVVFNINTIHGSYVNTTDDMRRLVRVGYRNPSNRQQAGQSHGRPGLMVRGRRCRHEGRTVADPTGAKAELAA